MNTIHIYNSELLYRILRHILYELPVCCHYIDPISLPFANLIYETLDREVVRDLDFVQELVNLQ